MLPVHIVQAFGAAVLEKFFVPGHVKNARCVAQGVGVVHAMAAVVLKGGKSSQRLVTGATGNMPVNGKVMIEKKPLAKTKSFFCQRVGSKVVNRLRETVRR